jgi:hypothetical protein
MVKLFLVGSLPKWLKGPVLKTGRGRKARESSNLSASAIFAEITPIIKLISQSLQTEGSSVCFKILTITFSMIVIVCYIVYNYFNLLGGDLFGLFFIRV